ncbi:Type 1 glutamine amidotransferase-like domain-containing protein [Streptomyces europaeiscabiei]|uniref:Peptidase E n=1 Tax=Streptomyces europaeiscabiei TaxID=146819 RepID=A0ABU4NA98_9ACTN|nr:peptidase E [Streptomyces europaeiscabiei]MDX2526824.1 peptidase E [Streptomyces europaeiscabiei]MDX2764674.1 peptidase E [Streptomyces europaeiscabiei]MDX2774528.1 peptidase E [Streptomyces europaeiscabiei]MDX3541420.1 peptidase E [Streptomyces europaeiscabiei]MDX3551761.1 peptidase E [Streptomyces europaeiscabiei]
MTASEPTIVATSGGHRLGDRTRVTFHSLVHHAVELSGVNGRRPKVMYVGTAIGDAEHMTARMSEAARVAGFDLTPLALFPMPNIEDVEAAVLEQDVVWVMGGSVANLLAVWRVHGLDGTFRRAWESGVVLSGVSAGSICWFQGGTTDSFGPRLRPVTDALGHLPYGNGVHYDSDEGRRPLVHTLVADGTLPETHCTDDGVGLVYRGTRLVEAVTELPGKGAYIVRREGDTATEERVEPRLLPEPRT